MGRSVVSPSDAIWCVALDYEVDTTYHECTRCGHMHYDSDAPEQCEECGLTSADAHTPFLPPQHDAYLGQLYWDEFVSHITETLTEAFPSLEPYTNSRSDREYLPYSIARSNEAIPLLLNRHAYIGISEYCGRVEIWCVPIEDSTYEWNENGLHAQWARSIEKRAERLLIPEPISEPLRMAA